MPGKLNIFQKTMLRWNEMHPYNAVHVADIKRPLDLERLTGIIDKVLESYGLTGLVIDKKKGTYHYRGEAARTELKLVGSGGASRSALASEIERQLNEPFPEGPEINPFRFFVLDEKSSFWLGLAYLHSISGGENIVSLVRNIADVYMNKETTWLPSPLKLYPGSYAGLIRMRPKYLIGWLYTFPSFISSIRRSFRPRYKDPLDHAIGFSSFSIGEEQFHALLRKSKAWGVTMNDIFLGLLLKSLSSLYPERLQKPRRRNISLAAIANIRKDLDIGSEDFGLFLGSFIVSHTVPRGVCLEELAGDVHRQTLRIKKHKLYLRSVIELAAARIFMSFLSPERRQKFYPKNYPLWGGITNMNLDAQWTQDRGGATVDYLRAVCTGPVSPLVLAITTVNDIINVGVTFRKTVYSDADVNTIIGEFAKCVEGVKETA